MLKINKNKHKKTKTKINNKEQVLVIAQEIKFARLLSGNEKKSRDRVLKTLRKWLANCFQKGYQFKEEDFVRIWKGLFYAVWMSDKPLIQEELCDDIASLLDEFPKEQTKGSILMFKAGLRILGTEWYGIDQHRMDKFLMLVRRLLRAVFRVLERCGWSQQNCIEFTHALTENEGLFSIPTPTYARNSLSLLLHITECYLEELAKVSKGILPEDSLVTLVTPFASQLAHSTEIRSAVTCRKLFNYLLRQSEVGQEYEARRMIWSEMGCPEGGPNALVPVSDEEEDPTSDAEVAAGESTSSPLDPRAGHVNVLLPTLPVPSEKLAQLLREYLKTTSGSAHRRVKILCQRFIELSKNKYPLQVKDDVLDRSNPELKLPKAARAAKKLGSLEKQLLVQSDELALRGLNKKQRKRLLAKARDGVNIVEQLADVKAQATNGGWQIEDAEVPKSKKRKIENKENMNGMKRKKRKRTESKERAAKKQRVKTPTQEESIENSTNTNKKIKNAVGDSNDSSNNRKNLKTRSDHIDVASSSGTKEKMQIESPVTENKVKIDKTMERVKKYPKSGNPKEKNEINEKNTFKLNGIGKIKNPQGNLKRPQTAKGPSLLVNNKVKRFQKPLSSKNEIRSDKTFTGKKVKFALKKNSMQGTVDYYRSVKNSPSIPYDGARRPAKTNLKPNSTPSPINPFFKRKLRTKS